MIPQKWIIFPLGIHWPAELLFAFRSLTRALRDKFYENSPRKTSKIYQLSKICWASQKLMSMWIYCTIRPHLNCGRIGKFITAVFFLSFHFPQWSSGDFHEFSSPAHKYLIFTIWCFRYVLLIIDGKSGGALIVNFSRRFDLCAIFEYFFRLRCSNSVTHFDFLCKDLCSSQEFLTLKPEEIKIFLVP